MSQDELRGEKLLAGIGCQRVVDRAHAGNSCAHLLHLAGAEGAFGQSARVLGGGYAQLPADHWGQTGSDLLVARHSRDIVLWPTPFGVLGAAHLATAV